MKIRPCCKLSLKPNGTKALCQSFGQLPRWIIRAEQSMGRETSSNVICLSRLVRLHTGNLCTFGSFRHVPNFCLDKRHIMYFATEHFKFHSNDSNAALPLFVPDPTPYRETDNPIAAAQRGYARNPRSQAGR